jgi:superfamily II DNA or RNA helicase
MPQTIQALFEAIRRECSTAEWSRGVELVRADALSADSDDGDEIVIRVSERGGLICPTVTLHPPDEDWDCDCGSPRAACAHSAAAVIALRRARKEGAALPSAEKTGGRIGYRFRRCSGGLELDRVVISGGEKETLKTTLAAIASGRVVGPRFLATQTDLAVERVLGSRLHGALPRGIIPRLLATLADCPNVQLDGAPVRTSGERIGLCARLVDADEGFRLSVGRDPRVTEAIGVDTVLCGDTLHPVGATNLTGRELEELTRGRTFGPGDVADLVTEILPSLSQRIPIDVQTRRLPKTVKERPRLAIEVQRDGEELSVLPTLVYGDPPIARVDAGKLVSLRGPVPLRDEARERQLIRKIQNELQLLPGRRIRLGGEEAVEFASRLEAWGGDVLGDGWEAFRVAPPLRPRVRIHGCHLDVRFVTSGEGDGSEKARRGDPARVLRAWREGASLAPLEGGGWAPLPADWLDRFGHRIADLLAARSESGEVPRCALPDLATVCADLGEPIPPAVDELRSLVEGFDGISPCELPRDLAGTLRAYQRSGVDWLCLLRDAGLGALLADDMGLGKTLQALCAVRGRTLVVAPTSVLHNWAQEIERFRPGLSWALYHGPGRSLDPGVDVTITSYAILRLDADKLAAERWDTAILDEAQAIKNPDSKVARAAYRLEADFRVTLSGTPVENRLDELWSQFHFINRGLLGSRRDFEERYAKPIGAGATEAAERLRARVRPFVLRRLKNEVAPELPPRTEIVLRATLDESERDTYDAVRAATSRDVVDVLASGSGVLAALEALLRLRQAACHPALLPGQVAESSSKVELLLELVDEAIAEGHKMLVFSQWTSLLDLVEPHLRGAGFAFARIDGSTRDRGDVVDRFQAPDGPPILLASLKAGGVGLNLTAADHVFILDPWWNPFVEDQAADRAHRIGQDRPVSIYRLVAADTVEERVLALQEKKREIAEAALGTADRATALTRDDLLALLE